MIIPALNEAAALRRVLAEIPAALVKEVIVVDNGSTDGTARVAAALGARVAREPERGYGAACLRGIDSLSDTDIVVFLDADHSDFPDELEALVEPILKDRADFVVSTRVVREKGALQAHQRFGNRLATSLIRILLGASYSDLGPFRAIRRDALDRLEMRDRTFGWTVEMQVKAVKRRLRIVEVPVPYRRRIGKSKISGTLSGSLRAGWGIITTILRHA